MWLWLILIDIQNLLEKKLNEKLNPVKKDNNKNKKKLKLEKVKIKKNRKINYNTVGETPNKYSYSKFNLSNNKIINIANKKKNNKIKKNKTDINISYNEYELYLLPYALALKFDKSSIFNNYITLIKTKQLILFSFYPKKDNNLLLVKIDMFFLFFSIHHFINALFFNEKVIHTIYIEEGIYNLSYFIPQILYSFIISHILCAIIHYFFYLTEIYSK